MKKTIISGALALAIFSGQASANDEKQNELIGLGSGALVGAAVAGPLGAMVAGIFGLMIADDVNDTNHAQILETDLLASREQLQQLQQDYQLALAKNARLEEAYADLNDSSSQQLITPFQLENNIQFRTASAELEAHYEENLALLAQKLKNNPELTIELFGYADRRGDELYNQTLSEQRSEKVREFLISQGVSEVQVIARGLGEAFPAVEQQSFESDFFDRRVVLRMQPNDKTLTASQK